MYNASFYPTPQSVASAMLQGFDAMSLAGRTVLEPSAGKGNLADAIVDAMNISGWAHHADRYRPQVHCVEIEPELQAALRGKGYPLVGTDFLTFWPDEKYDLIVMNPPFADAEKHLLHAWEILDHGDILCLCNEQTIAHATTANRSLLANIIADHGTVTALGACFADAERKTNVRVALIHLTKAQEEPRFSFMQAGPDEDPYARFKDEGRFDSELATRNLIGNLVANYDRCRTLFLEIAHLTQELGHYARQFPRCGGEAFAEAVKPLMDANPTRHAQEHAYNAFVRSLKGAAWDEVFRLTEMQNLVSEGVRKEVDALLKDNQRMAFSEGNIASLLETLFLNRGAILKQCVVEAFDHMTRYYKENRVHVEGWKTNDAWRVNERVVLPGMVGLGWTGKPDVEWNRRRTLDDIDRALAFLEGKKLEDVGSTIVKALEQLSKEHGCQFSGVLFTSTYFEMRAYKKGTLHLRFLDRTLWERFNLMAADGKNWLPDDVKTRERETKAREKYADQCGLPLAV